MADTIDTKSVIENPVVHRGNNQRIPYRGVFKNQSKLTFHENGIYFELRSPQKIKKLNVSMTSEQQSFTCTGLKM